MSDGPCWFAPKRFGYGAGLPISWQGWAITLGFVAILMGLASEFRERPTRLVATIVPTAIIFLLICARMTRGGWRWRWGEED